MLDGPRTKRKIALMMCTFLSPSATAGERVAVCHVITPLLAQMPSDFGPADLYGNDGTGGAGRAELQREIDRNFDALRTKVATGATTADYLATIKTLEEKIAAQDARIEQLKNTRREPRQPVIVGDLPETGWLLEHYPPFVAAMMGQTRTIRIRAFREFSERYNDANPPGKTAKQLINRLDRLRRRRFDLPHLFPEIAMGRQNALSTRCTLPLS